MSERPFQQYLNDLTDKLIANADKPKETFRANIEVDELAPIFREETVIPNPKKKMSFFEGAVESFKYTNLPVAGARSLIPDDAAPDFTNASSPDDWNAFNVEAIEGTDQRYWDLILNSENAAEQTYNRQRALAEMEKDEMIANAGIFPALFGGIAGVAADPTTYLFPQIAAARFARLSSAVIRGATKVAPQIALQSVGIEALNQFNRVGGNVEDFALDTLRDTAFGVGLWGIGQGTKALFRGRDVWAARKIVNASYEGVGVKVKVNKAGEAVGLVAEPMDNSVGAMQATPQVQKFLDEGAAFNGLGKWAIGKLNNNGLGSPLIQGLSSTYSTVKAWANRLANISVVTESIEKGIPRSITATEILREITNEARRVNIEMHDLYVEHLGFKAGITGTAQAIVKQLKDGLTFTRSEFDKQVARVISTEVQHANHSINQAANLMRKQMDKVYKEYLKVFDLPDNMKMSKTQQGYLMRQYNKVAMTGNQQGFIDTVIRELKRQDDYIIVQRKPIDDLMARNKALNKLLKTPGVSDADARNFKNEIARNTRRRKALEQKLQDDARDGLIDPAVLEDTVWLNKAQQAELKILTAPIEALKLKIKNAQEDIKLIPPNQRKAANDKIKQMKLDLADLKAEFRGKAQAGTIDKKLWITSSKGFIEPRDVNAKIKFRKVYKDDEARYLAGEQFYNRIQGLTPEQINADIFGRMSGSGIPDPAMGRTLLIPDLALMNGGFLSNDLGKMLGVYSEVLGKRIALKKAFGDLDWDDGVKELGELVSAEFDAKKAKIEASIPAGPKRVKALNDETIKKNEAIKYMKDSYNIFMGNYAKNSNLYQFAKGMRNWASISFLGNVPLLQTGELFGIVFKQGIWPFLTAGLIPLVKKMNLLSKQPKFRANADHALVGLELETYQYSNWFYEGASQEHVSGGAVWGRAGRYMSAAAKVAPGMFMTNFMTNSLQRFSANVTQSRVMSDLFKAANGKLGKAGTRRLLLNGIDPKDAQKYIDNYNAAGGHKLHGGHVSNWHVWPDAKLQLNMRRAIMNDIQGSILEAGPLDKPFWTNDAFAGLPFQFMGYSYAAFNRFITPAFQTPDGAKLGGLVLMAGMGALYEPMRAWQKGEEFDWEADRSTADWMTSAIKQSGVMGWPIEVLQMADALIAPEFLDRYRELKYGRRGFAGMVLGPVGGLGQNLADVIKMVADGKLNQSGAKKALKVLPIPGNLILGKFANDAIVNSDLPENARGAGSWWEV